MNLSFLYKIDLPHCPKNICFRDLSTKEQIDLQKINLYYPQEIDYYLNYYDSVYEIISNCVREKENLNHINLIEFILLAIKIRIVSLGNILEFNIESNDKDIKNVKIKIDLNEIIRNILNISIDSLEVKEIEEKNIKIDLGWPNLKSAEFFYNLYFADITNEEKLIESLPEYIEKIKIDDDIINFNVFNHNQKEEIYDKLPMSIQSQLQSAIVKNINNLLQKDIFNISHLDKDKFNFYNLFFIKILKMIFVQNPRRIYEEVYILSNFNMSSDYIMNISPIERKLYMSFVESQQQKNKQQPEEQIEQNSNAVNDLAVEFGDIPPN